jgi:hypothetical protein
MPPTEAAPRPTEAAESVTGSSAMKPSTWSPDWGNTEAKGDGGDAAHAGEPGPDESDGHEEPTGEGSTVVVPEAADAGQTEGDGPGGAPRSPEADAEGAGETPPTGDPTEGADEDVPVLERLRRLATS